MFLAIYTGRRDAAAFSFGSHVSAPQTMIIHYFKEFIYGISAASASFIDIGRFEHSSEDDTMMHAIVASRLPSALPRAPAEPPLAPRTFYIIASLHAFFCRHQF